MNATLIDGIWYCYETKEGKVSSTLTFIFYLFCFLGSLCPSGKRHCDAPRNRPNFGISTF
jgi:hypothetical protein